MFCGYEPGESLKIYLKLSAKSSSTHVLKREDRVGKALLGFPLLKLDIPGNCHTFNSDQLAGIKEIDT